MEVAHLKVAGEFLKKYENKTIESVVGTLEFPELLNLGSNIDYVRGVLANTVYDTFTQNNYVDVRDLDADCNLCVYNKILGRDTKTDPSHMVIKNAIDEYGKDYRFETSPNPVLELVDRTKDNTSTGFPKA